MENQNYEEKAFQDIHVRLGKYDDIFSDFDIRPYSHRALSSDFLDEIKRAVRDAVGEDVSLILYAPEKDRSQSREGTIGERLKHHFDRHHKILLREKNRVLKLGFGMVSLGIVFMILATFIIFKDPTNSLFLSFLVVFLEPAAWFLLWEGMDQIIFHSKNINPELNFYKKMSDAKSRVSFQSY